MQKDDKMADDFYKNDIILIKDGAEFNEGDIIFILDANNKYKLRRVVKKGGDVTTTKCNICLNEEEQVDNIKIRGRAIGKIMLIGHIINFFKNKAVIVITAAFGFACLIISQYLIYEPRKVKKEEKEINI